MKILKDLIEKNQNSFLEITTVWNYHSVKSWSELISNKRSNLHKLLKDKSFISDNALDDGVTIFTGAKGRSQHSETEVLIFRGECDCGSYFSFLDLKDLGVR